MGEQRGLAPLLTVDLAPVTVELNLRESGARFPCKWSSVLEIYNDGRMRLIQRELIIRHSSIISQNGDNSVARFSFFAHYDRFVASSTVNP